MIIESNILLDHIYNNKIFENIVKFII